MSTFSLFAREIDLECDYHDCDWESTELFRGCSIDEAAGSYYSYMATYCSKHAAEHAEGTSDLTFVGEIGVTDD